MSVPWVCSAINYRLQTSTRWIVLPTPTRRPPSLLGAGSLRRRPSMLAQAHGQSQWIHPFTSQWLPPAERRRDRNAENLGCWRPCTVSGIVGRACAARARNLCCQRGVHAGTWADSFALASRQDVEAVKAQLVISPIPSAFLTPSNPWFKLSTEVCCCLHSLHATLHPPDDPPEIRPRRVRKARVDVRRSRRPSIQARTMRGGVLNWACCVATCASPDAPGDGLTASSTSHCELQCTSARPNVRRREEGALQGMAEWVKNNLSEAQGNRDHAVANLSGNVSVSSKANPHVRSGSSAAVVDKVSVLRSAGLGPRTRRVRQILLLSKSNIRS